MRFTILTLFPDIIEAYIAESILKRARERKAISVEVIDIRNFTTDKHRTADDRPYGGGPGMVMKAEPVLRAFASIKGKSKKIRVLIMSAAGRPFTGAVAKTYAKKYEHLVLIAGHYEGIDERIKKILKAEEVSTGDYVLTGGELPALVILDAVARQLPGVLGRAESLEEARLGVGVPVYTRPETLVYGGKKYPVPKDLRSGNHAKIEAWRRRFQKR